MWRYHQADGGDAEGIPAAGEKCEGRAAPKTGFSDLPHLVNPEVPTHTHTETLWDTELPFDAKDQCNYASMAIDRVRPAYLVGHCAVRFDKFRHSFPKSHVKVDSLAGLLVGVEAGKLLLPSALSILGGLAESIFNIKAKGVVFMVSDASAPSQPNQFSNVFRAGRSFFLDTANSRFCFFSHPLKLCRSIQR